METIPYTPHAADMTTVAVMQVFLAGRPSLISREEIQREIGDPIQVNDALAYLTRMGLVHQMGGFFWATRAAFACEDAVTGI